MSTIQPQHRFPENSLLARLPVHERNAVQRASVVIGSTAGRVLVPAGAALEHVLFPIDMVLGVVRRLRDGGEFELGLVGSEGMVGGGPLAEGKGRSDEVVVRSAGTAFCMPADHFRHQFDGRGRLHDAVLRYAGEYFSQVAQNSACSRHHRPEARLARWLLMVYDRSPAVEIAVDAPAAARFLGITPGEAEDRLHDLAAAGAIRERRESVIVLDGEVLEMRACECYESLRAEGD